MNKTELYRAVSEATGLSGRASVKVVNAVLDSIIKGARADGKATITNFGTFSVKRSESAKTKLPDGKIVRVPAHNRLVFKAGEAAKKAVNKKSRKK